MYHRAKSGLGWIWIGWESQGGIRYSMRYFFIYICILYKFEFQLFCGSARFQSFFLSKLKFKLIISDSLISQPQIPVITSSQCSLPCFPPALSGRDVSFRMSISFYHGSVAGQASQNFWQYF